MQIRKGLFVVAAIENMIPQSRLDKVYFAVVGGHLRYRMKYRAIKPQNCLSISRVEKIGIKHD